MIINTAFSYTKSKWKRWPLIEVDDVNDVSVITKYQGEYPYVWVKNKKYSVLDTFNWNYYPDETERDLIHNFPLCLINNKQPVRWDVLRLVPTTAITTTKIIKKPIIASYDTVVYPMYIYTFKDKMPIKKFEKIKRDDRPCHLVKGRQSLEHLYTVINSEYPVWLIDGDVELSPNEDLSFARSDADIFMFNVRHTSTGLTYADHSVQFINPSYFDIVRGKLNRPPIIKTVDTIVGTIDDISDPFKAWARAFNTFTMFDQTNIPYLKRQKSRVLGKYIGLSGNRLANLASAGIHQAEIYKTSENYEYDKTPSWDRLESMFVKFMEEHQTSKQTDLENKRLAQKLEKTKRIYGVNSEEYQKLSSQLDKSVESF